MQHALTCSSKHSSLLVHFSFEFNKSNYADQMFSKYFKASELNILTPIELPFTLVHNAE